MTSDTQHKNNLRHIATESQLKLETQQEIFRLLDDEALDISHVEQQILMMVSQEIDEDMEALGVPLDENDPELVAQREEFEQGMNEIQKEMEEDDVLIQEAFDYLNEQVEALA